MLSVTNHPFIKRFPSTQAAELVRASRLARYKNSALIFDEETESDSVCLILSGQVALTKKTGPDTSQIIAAKDAGDYFGELGVLDGSPRSTAALAQGEVHLAHIPKEKFLEILNEVPAQSLLQLFGQVSENLRSTNSRYITEVVRKEKITLVGEMANSMIHDFRNPFTSIRLAAECVAIEHPDAKTKGFANLILKQVDRLVGMMNEVLEFARGETRLQIKPVSLQGIFTEVKENNAGVVAAGVELEMKPTQLVIHADRDRFQRLLQNLVSNASDVLSNTAAARIVVSAHRRGGECILTVEDNGPGIPEPIRATLFEPFVTHGKASGTGLGLALVRSVVLAHRGTISFKTSAAGTKFIVKLPLNLRDESGGLPADNTCLKGTARRAR